MLILVRGRALHNAGPFLISDASAFPFNLARCPSDQVAVKEVRTPSRRQASCCRPRSPYNSSRWAEVPGIFMGNSLSQDSQAILEAATAGDVHLLKQQIACEPKLLDSVTLVKRRGVLHLAAKQGHPHIISTVLDPLLEAVRREYHVSVWTCLQFELTRPQHGGADAAADALQQQMHCSTDPACMVRCMQPGQPCWLDLEGLGSISAHCVGKLSTPLPSLFVCRHT